MSLDRPPVQNSDRLIQQSSYLYGVRFGAKTQERLLDIDAGSPSVDRVAGSIGSSKFLAKIAGF